jgi:hypothetical protein
MTALSGLLYCHLEAATMLERVAADVFDSW